MEKVQNVGTKSAFTPKKKIAIKKQKKNPQNIVYKAVPINSERVPYESAEPSALQEVVH